MKNRNIFETAVAATFALIAGAAQAECERGDLDARYCDADGDLITDIPATLRN